MNVVLVQADQLNLRSNLLQEFSPRETVVILIESLEELRVLPFHRPTRLGSGPNRPYYFGPSTLRHGDVVDDVS
jgi:hypothetical protein